MKLAGLGLIGAAAVCGAWTPAGAQTLLTTTRIASGLSSPLQVTSAPGDATRLFVVERGGRVKIVNIPGNTVNTTAFLDVSSLVTTSWLEYGLLSIVFHPDYAHNRVFYVNYTPIPASGTIADTLVVRYKASATNPAVADTSTAQVILRFGFGTRREHRSGWMGFGPDGYLYITTGDGGENDPDGAAQNLTLLRGKLLRIDVNGPDGIPGTADDDGFPSDANKHYIIPPTNPYFGSVTNAQEIWASGLRNAWRASFDRETGDLWIGDVGQSQREEVDFQAAGAAGGRNYGWRCTEGTFCTGLSGCTCNGAALTPPIHEYTHSVGLSVTGGYVYRGCAIPDLRGTYIFGDYQNSKYFSFRLSSGVVTNYTDRTAELAPGGGLTINTPASFGEDANGEIYFCDYGGGEVFKIVPRAAPPPSLTITTQPTSQTPCGGESLMLTAGATSTGSEARYQWRKDGVPLEDGIRTGGAHGPNLVITPSLADDTGSYDCLVSNACMSVATINVAVLVFDGCPCSQADVATEGNPDPMHGPDGYVTGVDFDVFVEAYFKELRYVTGRLIADLTDGLGHPMPDGFVTGTDFDWFVSEYFEGCP